MIVCLIDSMEDTTLLRQVYEGLDNIKLLVNPSSDKLHQVLLDNPTETLLDMGHGTGWGLLNANLSGYVLNGFDADELLHNRQVIGIWCHASDYAESYNVHGFFTSMFISNESEANYYNYNSHTNEDIFNEVTLFSKRVNKLLKDKTPLNEWVEHLRSQADYSKDYVAFNYNGLRYY